MRPLPFVWPYALAFWAVYVWAFLPEWKVVQSGRKGLKDADSKDSSSLKVIMGGMWRPFWLPIRSLLLRSGPFRRTGGRPSSLLAC